MRLRTTTVRSESAANMALAEMAEQDRLDEQQYQAKLANEAERQRKRDVNAAFWQSIKWAVVAIVLAAIALFTSIKIAG